jgi:hypothetical protein
VDIHAAFLAQEKTSREMGSPFMAQFCGLFAERLAPGDPVSERLLALPADGRAHRQLFPLRLAGALHALVLRGESPALMAAYPPHKVDDDVLWEALRDALRSHAGFVLPWLDRAPQTNEVRRSAIVVPGFLTIAERTGLALMHSEIGSSAGINLHWDEFGYRFGAVAWGDVRSPVQLAPAWRGDSPPVVPVSVQSRAGCDLYPIDPGEPDVEMRLLPYIWPDQPDRLARTRDALRIAAAGSERVERADVLEWLPRRLRAQPANTVHVIWHTIVWQYFDAATRSRARALIEQAGERADATRPLAWLSFEADADPRGASLRLRLWPGNHSAMLARADFHGRWVDWAG